MKFCPECELDFSDDHEVCPTDRSRLVFLSKDEDHLVGKEIDGRYKLSERIGEGGMGSVYIGTQAALGRKVAVKVLRRDLADDTAAVKRFFHEAKVVSRLRHPNTVTLYDFGQSDQGLLYIAMEYMTGLRLDELVAECSLNLPEVLEIIEQICQSLNEAHDEGIVHRDLKPENVFIDRLGSRNIVKVLDFGIAKVQGVKSNLTLTGMVFGTPAYMSPEQAQGFEIDHRTDLYSLGVLFFELLCGRLPYHDNSAMRLAMKHILDPVPSVKQNALYQSIPTELAELVTRMLAKAPNDRPDTAEVVRQVVGKISRDLESYPVSSLQPRLRNHSDDSSADAITDVVSGQKGALLLALRERQEKVDEDVRPLEDTGPNRVGQVYTTAQYSEQRKAVVAAEAMTGGSRSRAIWPAAIAVGLLLTLAIVLLVVLLTRSDREAPAANVEAAPTTHVATETATSPPDQTQAEAPITTSEDVIVAVAPKIPDADGSTGTAYELVATAPATPIAVQAESRETASTAHLIADGLSELRRAPGIFALTRRVASLAPFGGSEDAPDSAPFEPPRDVSIRLDLRPADSTARLVDTGEILCAAEDCASISMPWGVEPIEIEISRRRYQDRIISFVPDREQVLDVRLERDSPRAGDRRATEGVEPVDDDALDGDSDSDDDTSATESTSPLMNPVTIPH